MPKNNPASLVSLRTPDYKGSWWKDYYKVRSTLGIGLFTPVECREIPANTLFKIKPDIRFESLPMVSPLYDGFTLKTKFIAVPIRLYVPELRRNRQVDWGAIKNFEFPKMIFEYYVSASASERVENSYLSLAGSLLDMLGIVYGEMVSFQSFNNPSFSTNYAPNTLGNVNFEVNLLPFIAYLDSWLRFEFNKQDKQIPVIQDLIVYNSDATLSRYGTYRMIDANALQLLVDWFAGFEVSGMNGPSVSSETLLTYFADLYEGDILNGGSRTLCSDNQILFGGLDGVYPLFTRFAKSYTNPYDEELGNTFTVEEFLEAMPSAWSSLSNTTSNVGLLPVTYKGDYLTSWFNDEGIARLEQWTVQNGDSFLTMRKKNADMLLDLLSAISGNQYTDYLQFVMQTYLELKDHPILVGYDQISFGANEDTTATANTGFTGTDVLGAVASKARDYSNKVKPISFKTKEPLLLLVCASITPHVVYYQGVDRFMLKKQFSDLWHPQYDSKGFQRVNFSEYYNPFALPTIAETENIPYLTFNTAIDSNFVSPYVPLGWEYMQRNSQLKGGMKISRYKTWSLARDFSLVSREDTEFGQSTITPSFGGNINPIDGVVTGVEDDDTMTTLGLWMQDITSTYVKGFGYNIPFANFDKFDNHNFVVNFGFLVSQYQPITHTLITKNI